MTLESQYEKYLKENPDSNLSFENWKEFLGKSIADAIENSDEYIKNIFKNKQ